MHTNQILLQTLATLLQQQGIYAHQDNDSIIPGRDVSHRSSARIRVELASMTHEHGSYIAGIEVLFALSDGRPEATTLTPSFGVGATEAEAAEDALRAWFAVAAPPLFSVLMQSNVMDAALIHDGSSLGYPGWRVCLGPFLLWGADSTRDAALFQFARENKPLMSVASSVVTALHPPLGFLRLFWSHAPEGDAADVHVDGLLHDGCCEALLRASWPTAPGRVRYAQFAVLIFSGV